MRRTLILTCFGVASLLALPLPAASETRDAYLSRLREICDAGCQQPRQLLRTARKRPASDASDMAGILDIAYVSRRDTRWLLHQQAPNQFDMSILDFGMPNLDESEIVNVNSITIELDDRTALDLLGGASVADATIGGALGGEDIVVEADRKRRQARPSLAALESIFRNRRVVVRGMPRLDVAFSGSRRDRRQKKLTIVLESADDLVLLPRYDKNAVPILDGSLEGLRAP